MSEHEEKNQGNYTASYKGLQQQTAKEQGRDPQAKKHCWNIQTLSLSNSEEWFHTC